MNRLVDEQTNYDGGENDTGLFVVKEEKGGRVSRVADKLSNVRYGCEVTQALIKRLGLKRRGGGDVMWGF